VKLFGVGGKWEVRGSGVGGAGAGRGRIWVLDWGEEEFRGMSGEVAADFGGIDEALQESPVHTSSEANLAIDFDDGDGFSELSDEEWVSVDVNDFDRGESMLKAEEGFEGFVAEVAIVSGEESAGAEEGAPLAFGEAIVGG
jgi:hypothetical protein